MKRSGFTLVELSIVLVILGLLVGGVLTGQSLIRAAELRTVTTQEEAFITAVNTFKGKYFAIPGDMTNAQNFWGTAAACPGTAAAAGTLTCNGDGNGKLDMSTNSSEPYRFWQHLTNAGLIEGNYDGVVHGGTYGATIANSPQGRISGSLWYAAAGQVMSGLPVIFDGDLGTNFIEFGTNSPNSDPVNPILKPEDAYNIDVKMDDGKPATGKIVIRANNGISNCTDTSSSSNLAANYLLSNSAVQCSLYFRQAF